MAFRVSLVLWFKHLVVKERIFLGLGCRKLPLLLCILVGYSRYDVWIDASGYEGPKSEVTNSERFMIGLGFMLFYGIVLALLASLFAKGAASSKFARIGGKNEAENSGNSTGRTTRAIDVYMHP